MRRTLGIGLALVAAVASLVWFFLLRPGPASLASPEPAPVREGPVAPAPVLPRPDPFAVAASLPEPEAPLEGGCSDLGAVYDKLRDQGLEASDRACLDARIEADDDAEGVLRLLVVEAWNRDPKAWEHRAVQLASLTVDPDLHYKLALHFDREDQPALALHHAEVAMEESHAWPPAVVGVRTARLDRLRQTLCEAEPTLDGCR